MKNMISTSIVQQNPQLDCDNDLYCIYAFGDFPFKCYMTMK